MRNIWTIASREYKLYFANPAAYMISAMILVVVGILFYANIQYAVANQYAPGVEITLGPLSTLLMLATPAVTTRLLAEEQRMGTIELLLTAPVRDWELVIGKWLGGLLLLLTIVAVTFLYPLLLNQFVKPGIDQGPLITGYLGIILLCAALVGVGVFISSLFNNQIAAFAATLGVMVLLWWILRPIASVAGEANVTAQVISYFDFSQHFYENFMTGVIELKDVVYFISITIASLFLGTVTVETRRWR